jgi:hypothetical protein
MLRQQKSEPVPEMSDAEKVRCFHSELKDLEVGRPIHWSHLERIARHQEITRVLRKFGDVV